MGRGVEMRNKFFKMLIVLSVLLNIAVYSYCERTTIAVLPFKNKAGIGESDASTLVDMLNTTLAKTGKFSVIERENLGDIANEQLLSTEFEDKFDPSYAIEIGKLQNAQYLVIGVVTEAGMSKKSANAYKVNFQSSELRLSLDVKFVDTSTGEIILADTFTKSKKKTLMTSEDSKIKISEGPLGQLARETVDDLAMKLTKTVYPPKVVKVAENKVILNYGEVCFDIDQEWEVFKKGEALIDPDTGTNLGSEEIKVGKIKICSVKPTMAEATIIEGTKSITAGCLCRKYDAPVKTKSDAPVRRAKLPIYN